MDPVTAFVNLATALLKYLTVIAEGQPEEVRRELWSMYVSDLKWWRKFLKIAE